MLNRFITTSQSVD